MALSSGTRLGPYEIISGIGAGGMGEVYRARDTRLGRDVALKVLPPEVANDPARRQRFEQEARAASALNHPNIVATYDVGVEGGVSFIVSEFVDGESLRTLLQRGPLRARKALEIGSQIADGMAAAHAAGIVHRDLKPDNIMIARDGRAKVLDFGLAKQVAPAGAGGVTATFAAAAETQPGMVMGTAGYMSPEQVRGEAADARSDIFSFGVILYEMLAGRRAFPGETSVEVMNGILREDPLELPDTLPPSVEQVVRHCLEKDPGRRFQSAQDLAFGLKAMLAPSTSGSGATPVVSAKPRRLPRFAIAGGVLLALLYGGLSYYLGIRTAAPPKLKFQRLTFRRGAVPAARFAPDGNTVVYSAAWEDEPSELFTVRMDSPESRPLGFSGAQLLGISSSSELALSLNTRLGVNVFAPTGMLARAPFSGGAPRSIQDRIDFADWTLDGSQMAIVRETDKQTVLEFPPGKVLYQTSGYISNPRISPSGDQVAFIDHPLNNDNGGTLAVVDKAGTKRTLTGSFTQAEGVTWRADGSEIWFTASQTGAKSDVRAVTLQGRERIIYVQSGNMVLQDIAKDGRVLITNTEDHQKLMFRGASDERERDLSWLDWSVASDLSPDGKLVAFGESGEGTATPSVYLRETTGAPAVKLGPGYFPTFSADGQFAVAADSTHAAIAVYPVGQGESRRIDLDGFTIMRAGLLPGGKRLWFAGSEKTEAPRLYLTSLAGEKPHALTPEGVRYSYPGATPDGKYLVGLVGPKTFLFPVDGGNPVPLEGILDDERVSGWSKDGQSVFVSRRSEIPVKMYRVDRGTGRRELVREIVPFDRAGLIGKGLAPFVTPDGKNYVFSMGQTLSDLHIVEGLK